MRPFITDALRNSKAARASPPSSRALAMKKESVRRISLTFDQQATRRQNQQPQRAL
jgi:hypothetical protein